MLIDELCQLFLMVLYQVQYLDKTKHVYSWTPQNYAGLVCWSLPLSDKVFLDYLLAGTNC